MIVDILSKWPWLVNIWGSPWERSNELEGMNSKSLPESFSLVEVERGSVLLA